MSHKKQAHEDAEKHGIEIVNYASSQRGEMWGDVMLCLPSGFQISQNDDRTGTTMEGAGVSPNEFWKTVRKDLAELIAFKDEWTQIGN